VAWRAKNTYENQEGWFYAEWHPDGLTPQVAELLYPAPQKRTWVGLTEAQCGVLWKVDMTPFDYYQAIEAKLKDKNI
jgi:hypothetical protein